MKLLKLTGFLQISIFALVLMLSTGSVNAQTNTNGRAPTTVVERDNTVTRPVPVERDHDDTDWGWLGLLGLLGLAGLLPKKRTIEHDRIDPGSRTTNRP
jgi:hypothetical protein